MMDIEAFVQQDGRDDLVKQVRSKIDEMGIQYLYLQFVSITGRICGKGIPSDHWETIAERGFQLVYGATVNLFVNRHGEYLGYGPHDKELVGIPEPETFCQLPWGQARRPPLVHPVPQPGRARRAGRLADRRLPRQPAPHPCAIPRRP